MKGRLQVIYAYDDFRSQWSQSSVFSRAVLSVPWVDDVSLPTRHRGPDGLKQLKCDLQPDLNINILELKNLKGLIYSGLNIYTEL